MCEDAVCGSGRLIHPIRLWLLNRQLETALCPNGIAVTNTTQNARLVEDCTHLLGLKDRLIGRFP